MNKITRRETLKLLVGGATAATAIAFAPAGLVHASTKLETVEDGKLIVAFTGDMPGTSWENGKLIGADGEILQTIADRLKLQIQPAQMDWSATIASVQSSRADIMLGMMGWTKERGKIMNVSDPIYYAGTRITQRKDTNFSKLDDLKNKRIAMMTGTMAVTEIKQVEGADIKLFDTLDAALKALSDGRIDLAFVDSQTVQYMTQKDPSLPIKLLSIEDPFNPKFPATTAKWNVVMGIRKEANSLAQAINAEIDSMWTKCENRKICEKYGLGEAYWFTPPESNDRAGADRAADWKQPVSKSCS